MYSGRWITGTVGASKLSELSKRLDELSKKEVFKNNCTNHRPFQPWMTCRDNLDYFIQGCSKPIAYDNKSFLEKNLCQWIKDGLRKDTLPLGHIRILDTPSFEINENYSNEENASVSNAIRLLLSCNESIAQRWNCLVEWILPIRLSSKPKSELGRGLSSQFFRKAIFIELPSESPNAKIQTVMNLAHEMAHQAVFVYQNADPLFESDSKIEVYSPIRRVKRPLQRSFHAYVVCGYVLEALLALRRQPTSDLQIELLSSNIEIHRRHIAETFNQFNIAGVQFTRLGREIFNEVFSLSVEVVS